MAYTDLMPNKFSCVSIPFAPTLLLLLLATVCAVAWAGPTGNCGIKSPAFCDDFNGGPSAIRGRGGDLDPKKWSVTRLAPQDYSGNGPVANPVRATPIPACRASFSLRSVLPPNDTLICDPNGTKSGQLMSVVALQNYGNLSYMVRQPFDFLGRIGIINFDVDVLSVPLGGFVTVSITEDPVPGTTFREFSNFEPGPTPKNGIMIRFANSCNSNASAAPANTMAYANYAPAILKPELQINGRGCVATRQGFLNRFQIRLSVNRIEIYGSDFSPDNGTTFPNFRKVYAAGVSLNFSRGYVHFESRNHATIKYGFGENAIFYWDNIGFDGPVLSGGAAYEIPDNTTTSTYVSYNSTAVQNLGYLLRDGASGTPAGMYDPVNPVTHHRFHDLDLSGATGAKLTFNLSFNICCGAPRPTWGIRFRFNGGTWREHLLSPGEIQALNISDSFGLLALALDVPLVDLRKGMNTLEFLPVNAPMDYPPVVANIDLIIFDS